MCVCVRWSIAHVGPTPPTQELTVGSDFPVISVFSPPVQAATPEDEATCVTDMIFTFAIFCALGEF